MLNNFIYAQTKNLFLEALNAGNILDEAIVFIEDTKEIWNHGHYFGGTSGSGIDPEILSGIETAIATLQSDKADKSELANYAKKNELPSLDGYLTKTVADGLYATIAQYNTLNQTVGNIQTELSNKATKDELSTGLAGKLDNSAASGFVPTTRKVNGVALDQDITITAADPNAATKTELNTTNTNLANLTSTVNSKVDKVAGKGLSTYDFNDSRVEEIARASNEPIRIRWEDLKDLRDNNELIEGRLYRITDYVTTTTQENTQSAGHRFDIIVLALDNHTLAEEAWAIYSEEDPYFADNGANLSAWKIWYCLDNDTSRFAWADSENGKGVIYRMIDDNNNDCSFDFKNIMFLRYDKKFYYTLCVSRSDGDKDNSFNVHNNQIMSFYCMVINSNNCKVGEHCSATIDIERSENIVISNSCSECYISDSTNMYIGTESERIEVYDCRDFSIGNHVGGVVAYDSIDCYVGDYAHNISFEASVSCKALFGVYEAYFFEKQLVTCNEKVYFFDIEKGDVKLDFNVHDLGDDFLNLHIIVENFCGPLSFRTEEYGELGYEVNVYRGDKWLGATYGECLFDSNESMRDFERDVVPIEDILWEDLIVGETLKVVWSLLDTSSNPIVTYEQDVVYNGRTEE